MLCPVYKKYFCETTCRTKMFYFFVPFKNHCSGQCVTTVVQLMQWAFELTLYCMKVILQHTWRARSSHLDLWQWRSRLAPPLWCPPAPPWWCRRRAERWAAHPRLRRWPAQWSGPWRCPGPRSGGPRACWRPRPPRCVCVCSQSPGPERKQTESKSGREQATTRGCYMYV